jgi:hypothetical protein
MIIINIRKCDNYKYNNSIKNKIIISILNNIYIIKYVIIFNILIIY